MPRSKRRNLRTFVQRTLVIRLASVGLCVAALLGAVEYLIERHRVSEEHVEYIVSAAGTFAAHHRYLIENGLTDEEGIQEAFEELVNDPGRRHFDDWRFVLMRLYDLEGERVAEVTRRDYPFMGAVREALAHEPGVPEETPYFRIARLGGRAHVHSHIELRDSTSRAVGRLVVVVALSDEGQRQLRFHAFKESFYAILVVIITTILLYPVILHLMRRLCAYAVSLLEANLDTQETLGTAIALRDSETSMHNYRVTIMAVRLAEVVGLSRSTIRALIKGSFLHDVGKIGVPDAVLLKPGRLSESEFDLMKRHVEYGAGVVKRSDWLVDAQDVVIYHHEKFDGSGYLAGIEAEDIPVAARIFTVVDVFDALTSERPYKDAYSAEKALELMEEERDSRFDPALLDAFLGIAVPLHEHLRSKDVSYSAEMGEIVSLYFFQGVDDIEY